MNPFLINMRGIVFFFLTSNVIQNIPTEYIQLFTGSLKHKQGFETVMNWARSGMRFTHPNQRGTNIALIILPLNKASLFTQRIELRFHHLYPVVGPFLLHFLVFPEGAALH